MRSRALNILMLSLHGKVRARDIELGCDADTGGQVLYVIELAKALAAHPGVNRVDLLTRRFADPGGDPAYCREIEPICEGARIVRIPCGPNAYLRKEELWPHIGEFTANARDFVLSSPDHPDIIHGHYADAGLAGARLADELGCPFAFTGHSLGRVKQARLLDKGGDPEELESRFNFSLRFRAEEEALREAAFVVTSTRQEIDEQYAGYFSYSSDKMHVIPPGLDLKRFRRGREEDPPARMASELARFLTHPEKPMILALARPDERKNFPTLLRAYGRDPDLQAMANLVLVAGNRDGVGLMGPAEQKVMSGILELVDEYDLYGKVAYPKHHEPEDVPELYRLAAKTGGAFVNPALTEPFGLTLLEAAACGLPVVSTNDGGPTEIVKRCRNGLLVDPLDAVRMAGALRKVVGNRRAWRIRSSNGVTNVRRFYSWAGHADAYVERLMEATRRRPAKAVGAHTMMVASEASGMVGASI